MKSGFISGFIAGLISGIITFFFGAIAHGFHLYTFILGLASGLSPEVIIYGLSPELEPPILNLAISEITLGVIWGIIFGILYSQFYESIPDRGISKGINFGLLIWLIAWFPASLFWIGYGFFLPEAFASSLLRVIQLILYGIFIGVLYERASALH